MGTWASTNTWGGTPSPDRDANSVPVKVVVHQVVWVVGARALIVIHLVLCTHHQPGLEHVVQPRHRVVLATQVPKGEGKGGEITTQAWDSRTPNSSAMSGRGTSRMDNTAKQVDANAVSRTREATSRCTQC